MVVLLMFSMSLSLALMPCFLSLLGVLMKVDLLV